MWDSLDELLHQTLMMRTQMVPETTIFNQLARLIAREDFINVVDVKASDHTPWLCFWMFYK
jgi:hypothetical protein